MSKADPFTSDNARTRDKAQESPTQETKRIKDVYGPHGDVRHLKYTGSSPEWQAGYLSRSGFHIRGRDTDSCAAAVDQAVAAHARDAASPTGQCFPTPQHPNPSTSWQQRNPEGRANALAALAPEGMACR